VTLFGILDLLPAELQALGFLGLSLAQWLVLAGLIIAAVVLGLLVQWAVLGLAGLIAKRTRTVWDDELTAVLRGPGWLLIALVLLAASAPLVRLPTEPAGVFSTTLSVALILTATWLALRFLGFGSRLLLSRLARGLKPREISIVETQLSVGTTLLRVLIVIVGGALVLLQFEVVRTLGVSLLASAGVAGLVIGFAAQRSLSALFASVQLALTHPIRIGDSIVVEGESGTVEEITLTFVVVRLWDQRRLLVPIGSFLEKPFQNLTRGTGNLLGTVFVQTDHTVPVAEVRAEVKRIVEKAPQWDGKVQNLQVTDLSENGVQLRVLVSAADGGQLWELRCLVREELLGWLQTRGRQHLPRRRLETSAGPSTETSPLAPTTPNTNNPA
jgi:small-conductance mechanosensitive channel